MSKKNNTRRTGKGIKWIAIIILLLVCFLSYYQLLYKSPIVNSNIFKLKNVLSGHHDVVWAVKFSPGGNWLASGSVDSTIRIWDKETGAVILTLKQSCGVTNLAFSADGNLLASSAYDAKVRLWRLPQGILVKEFSGHQGTVWSVGFSPDETTIVSSGEDATIRLWDIKTGLPERTLVGHSLNVWDVKFSPDGSKIASGSFDKTIKIWNTNDGKLLQTLTDHSEAIVSLAFSPDGRMLASTSDDKTIKIWDTGNWRVRRTITVPEHTQAVDFSPDNKKLLTGGRDKPVIGELLQNFLGDSKYNKGVSMRLWEVQTGKLLQTFSQHSNDVNDVSFCAGGKWIASGSSDNTIQLWQIAGALR